MQSGSSRLIGAVIVAMLAAACGGRDAPTRPSTSSAAAVSPAAESTAANVTWNCLAQSVSTAGVFESAIAGAECSRQPTLQSRVFAAATAPERPQSLTAFVNGSTVTLTWLAPTSPDPPASYVIEAGSSAGATNLALFDTLSTATSFTTTGVPAGTYFVRVRARNSAGTSAASNRGRLRKRPWCRHVVQPVKSRWRLSPEPQVPERSRSRSTDPAGLRTSGTRRSRPRE